MLLCWLLYLIHSGLAFVGLLEYNLLIAIVLLFGRCLDDYFERWRPLARALALAQMWKVLEFYTLNLLQCAFFMSNLLINFVLAFVGLLESNLLIDSVLAFVRLLDGIHCRLLPVYCSVFSFYPLPP